MLRAAAFIILLSILCALFGFTHDEARSSSAPVAGQGSVSCEGSGESEPACGALPGHDGQHEDCHECHTCHHALAVVLTEDTIFKGLSFSSGPIRLTAALEEVRLHGSYEPPRA